METEFKSPQLATDTESLKLTRNSRGYNWEIKILSTDIDRIIKINEEMIKQFAPELSMDLPDEN